MALLAGTRLGPYEIIASLGTGGMGEVYRARDTKLKRDVALKVLPDTFARDTNRLARFRREAELLATLNHSNIAAIYGLEESDGVQALVLELVEGPTLAERIEQGAIPLDDALPIARQIACALEAAHEHGIIHRDVKPANIKLRFDGTVKVLDFGLAKAFEKTPLPSDLTQSLTVISPAPTLAGVILGTAAYMSPEQANGKPVDKRADIWAFGCVLYEMLTGKRPFTGDDVVDTIAAVIRGEPDWNALPAGVPPVVQKFLRRCFCKNLNDRVQDIGDVRLALDGAFEVTASQPIVAARPSRWTPARIGELVAAVALVSAAAAWLLKPTPSTPQTSVRRFVVKPDPGPLEVADTNRDVAITPDGSALVYLAGTGPTRQLYVRRFDSLKPIALHSAAPYFEPFVSPDSHWVAFCDETDYTLRKIALTGGPPVSIASVGREILGATWGSNDTIVYATTEGLFSVPAAGGTPEPLAKPDTVRAELTYCWPVFLPGAKVVVFTIRGILPIPRAPDFSIAALDLQSRAIKTLLRGGTSPKYSMTGHLAYLAEGTLRAVPFDPVKLQVTGDAVAVIDGITAKRGGGADFDLADDGTLVYVAGVGGTLRRRVALIDANGIRHVLNLPPHAYSTARMSPDGTRIALDALDEQQHIWIWDLARETLTRLTADSAVDIIPVWTPDSRRIVFRSDRDGPANLYVQSADGAGTPRRLAHSPLPQVPLTVTPDGMRVLFRQETDTGARAGDEIMMTSLDGRQQVVPVLATNGHEMNAELSPDGKWLLYESDESGELDVFVRPYADVQSGRWQISKNGGHQPMWRAGGREVLFLSREDHLLSVEVQAGERFNVGSPKELVQTPLWAPFADRSYDASPDGKRLLVIEDLAAGEPQSASLVIVLNWTQELKRLAPKK
jgi:Tol biopolymer transport system component